MLSNTNLDNSPFVTEWQESHKFDFAYDLMLRDQPKTSEFTPTMAEGTGILPGFTAVAGKSVHVGFDDGRLTSDAGILSLAAVEQRLRIAERLAACPAQRSADTLI